MDEERTQVLRRSSSPTSSSRLDPRGGGEFPHDRALRPPDRAARSPILAAAASAVALLLAPSLLAAGPRREARLVAPASLAAGSRGTVAVEMTVGEKWHVNSHTPSEKFLVPTNVDPHGSWRPPFGGPLPEGNV